MSARSPRKARSRSSRNINTGMEEIIVGVVGVLQFEVLTYRLENEYNVEVPLEKLPYEYIRWIENKDEVDVAKIQGTSDMKTHQGFEGQSAADLCQQLERWHGGGPKSGTEAE